MFDIPILEVAMGLVFIYLLFSLLVSGINEAVLGHLIHLRSKVLEDGLRGLLSDDARTPWTLVNILRAIWKLALALKSMLAKKAPAAVPAVAPALPAKFVDIIISHPLIKGLATCGLKCPHYLPAGTFSSAALGILLDGAAGTTDKEKLSAGIDSIQDPHAKKLFKGLLQGEESINGARQRLEDWFNDSMDRVTGAYKRRIQFWLYFWATIIVVCLNLDTIDLTRRLMSDSEFRTAVVNSASSYLNPTNGPSAAGQDSETKKVANIQDEINRLKLPLGWAPFTNSAGVIPGWVKLMPVLRADLSTNTNSTPDMLMGSILSGATPCPTTSQGWWLKALGLFVTIMAISQGAPFWFDVLNKVTNLRSGGAPPKTDKSDAN
jgi:hypothetical protein